MFYLRTILGKTGYILLLLLSQDYQFVSIGNKVTFFDSFVVRLFFYRVVVFPILGRIFLWRLICFLQVWRLGDMFLFCGD